MVSQEILSASNGYKELDTYFMRNGIRNLLLVCDESIRFLQQLDAYFRGLPERLQVSVTRFSDFRPNPLYESVAEGVRVFRERGCDAVAAVGGGSALDVAKCIKLYSSMDGGRNYLEQETVPNDVPLLAVPTTAGTGSEATRYAVIYYNGQKQSVTDDSIIPQAVLMDPGVLRTLPVYQKKSTMMDALCHAVESFWSVNSTGESRKYSRQAIAMVLENKDAYLQNEEIGNAGMLQTAHLAGMAINITQTTAGHAMCYKLTGLYGIAHGHAAALCVRRLWPYMATHTDRCIDPRGEAYLQGVFSRIADAFGCAKPVEAAEKFGRLFAELGLAVPQAKEEDYGVLRTSVNPVRLKNNPVRLDEGAIDRLYREILAQN